METSIGKLPLYLLVMASLSVCCSPDPVEESYIPLITNSWTDLANTNHKFNLNSTQSGVSKGSFTGNETYDDSAAVNYPINGTFSNRSVTFKVERPAGAATYVGRFAADTLMDFGALKLFRRR